jgi:hypothetical protein
MIVNAQAHQHYIIIKKPKEKKKGIRKAQTVPLNKEYPPALKFPTRWRGFDHVFTITVYAEISVGG